MLLVATVSLVSAWCGSSAPDSPAPDTIFVGHFITLDASRPRAEAVGVKNGRIVSVGSRSEVERGRSGPAATIEIPGVALPGFADAHVHLASLGQQLERLDLRGLTKEQVLERVSAAAREAPPGALVSGSGWDQGFFSPPVFPTASDLDAVSGDHPIVLSRIDGHSSWVNSRVLALAGISRRTPDPAGGRIERNAAKEPTGILVDRAQDALIRVRPSAAAGADRERRVRAALQQYARWGLTSVHDAGTDLETIAVYKDLLARGDLTVRVYAMASGKTATDDYLASGPEVDLGDGRLTIRSFKVVADGALGSRGAALTDPYADAPGERGLDLVSDGELDQLIKAARAKGFQVNVHAIGDRTVRRVLDAFERGGVTMEERFRIEHASMIAPADRARFARLGVIASVQPVFVGEYSRWAEERVGPARIRWVLPIRDLIAEGVPLAFGTDFTASDSGDPIATLSGAVLRQSAAGVPSGGWYSDQKVDVDTALRLMTAGPARAAFEEQHLGSIAVGRYADLTILSHDPYALAGDALRTLRVRMTVVGGRVIFDARSADERSAAR